MKKTVKVAVALLIAGVVLALAGFAMAGLDFGNLNAGGALVRGSTRPRAMWWNWWWLTETRTSSSLPPKTARCG